MIRYLDDDGQLCYRGGSLVLWNNECLFISNSITVWRDYGMWMDAKELNEVGDKDIFLVPKEYVNET